MLLVRDGDEEAFGELIGRYEKKLINFFYFLGWDYHLSEDLTQEVFIKVYRYRHKYRETAKFQTFLFRIARNLWIDHGRKMRTAPGTVSLEKEVSAGEDPGQLKEMIEDTKVRNPSDRMKNRDISAAIEDAVNELAEDDRLIFLMVAKQGLKYKEIAAVMDIPEGTVKSKVYYTYRKLRKKLEGLKPLVE